MDKLNRRDFIQKATGAVSATWAAGGVTLNAKQAAAAPELVAATGQETTPLRLEVQGHALRFRAGWCDIPDWRPAIEVGNQLLETSDAQVKVVSQEPWHIRFRFPTERLAWDLRAETDPTNSRLILRSTLRNESRKPLALGKAFLLRTERLSGFFTPGDQVVYLAMKDGQGLNHVRELSPKSTSSDIAIQAFNQNRKNALQVGFATFLRAETRVEHTRRASSLKIEAWCDFAGWELEPGATTPTETLTLAVGEDPHAQLEAWADIAARLSSNPPRVWAEQANGWVGGTWSRHSAEGETYEDYILRNAKSIRERLGGYGIRYVWESIGNLKNGQPGDWLSWNTRNFPSGHQFLHDELAQHGLKWGLWCGAFMLSSRLEDKVKELWDALWKAPGGKEPMIYMKAWGYGLDNPYEDFHKPIYALDPTHPKTLAYLRKVFRTYREWGVRYYMIDFIDAAAGRKFYMARRTHAPHYDKRLVAGPEALQKGLQAIRDACGDDTYLLASSGPTYHTAGAMDSVRTGNDFGEGRSLSPAFPTYPGTYAITPPTYWDGPVHALTNQAANYHTHRKLYVNDSGNVLTVDKPLRLSQAQVYATLHVMSGGPSMLGDDITEIEEERLSLIRKTFPRPDDVAVPVDLFTRKERGYPHVYHRKVVKPWGSYDVVAVYNLETAGTLKQEIEMESLKLDPTREYHAWEFWNLEYAGKVRGRLKVEVPAYSVKVYRLTEDKGRPVILGTDMHALMGEVEINRCRWDSSAQTLSGQAIRPAGESGSLYLYVPPSLGVANPKGFGLARDFDHNCLIVRCPMRFEKGSAEWNAKFFKLKVAAPSHPLF